MSAPADDPNDRLAAALAEALSPSVGFRPTIGDLRRLSGGASRETFAFDLGGGPTGAVRPCVLQRTRAGTVGSLPMGTEAALVDAAGRAGVPVPGVLASGGPPTGREGEPDLGGAWMVVDRIDGETIARRILRDEHLAPGRRRLVADCGAALAAIHRIDDGVVDELPGGDPLEIVRQLVGAVGQAHPVLELGARWLDRTRPEPRGPAVVHGDFRLGNLVVGPGGLAAVLDWELAHRGDPLEDLGWLCVRAWRFGADEPVAGLGSRHELFAAYEAAGGAAVDPAAVGWWEAMGCLRWGAICLLQAQAHLSGAARSVELAAIGRRTCEAEYDLLLAMAELDTTSTLVVPDGAPTRPEGTAPLGPHDRPDAGELLEAVEEFLADRVVPTLEGRDRFHARVAANVVAMVGRELALGPGQAAAHQARLRALGVDDDVALAEAIRVGRFDDRLAEVYEALWWTTDDKLAVANPGYRRPEG